MNFLKKSPTYRIKKPARRWIQLDEDFRIMIYGCFAAIESYILEDK